MDRQTREYSIRLVKTEHHVSSCGHQWNNRFLILHRAASEGGLPYSCCRIFGLREVSTH